MRFADVITTAFEQIRVNKLRSFFTLLGIIVSVAFLVAVVAIISGMNAYVKENLASALKDELLSRGFRPAVRLEIADNCPRSIVKILLQNFDLKENAVYRINGPVNLNRVGSRRSCFPSFLTKDQPLAREGERFIADRPLHRLRSH